jgi:hypothetical protein
MHVEFTPGGECILKACLERNRILKMGTDGSFFRGNETVSFGLVLIGNQNVLAHGSQQKHFKGITLHLSARIIVSSPASAEIE